MANRIELGQIRAGLVVSCESAREINDIMITRMLEERSMEHFATSLATLTGGSGAVAVLLTDGSFSRTGRRRLLGGRDPGSPGAPRALPLGGAGRRQAAGSSSRCAPMR